MGWLSTATRTVASGIGGVLSYFFSFIYTIVWDTGLTIINVITPNKHVIPLDLPEYIPPKPTDSRSPCPALNALCNHGILPRDGRNFTFKEMSDQVHKTYNTSRTLSNFVTDYIARILRRNYNTDSLDLGDILVHNGIEHDGSITRYDTIQQPDQSIPSETLINDMIAASKDGKVLTPAEMSRIITTRLTHSKQTNGQFSLSSFHFAFAAGNAATLLLIFGGKVEDIKPFLLEERLPEGWSTKVRSRMGLTMSRFNSLSLRIILGIDPSWKKAKRLVESERELTKVE